MLPKADLNDLIKAKKLLENPGIAIKIANMLGSPLEKGIALLPDKWNKKIGKATRKALLKAANAAVFTMKDKQCE